MNSPSPLRQDSNPRRVKTIDLTTSCEYVIFVSSSGHCSLDCAYCIVNPIVKHQPSLQYEDFAFLFEQLDGRAFLIFSGKGDFFAGYKKKERLLERLLAHDIEVALDINGVMLHEFAALPAAGLDKIRFVNLTLHYRELRAKRALDVWRANARLLVERLGASRILSGFILTPNEHSLWREALDFYRHAVFQPTGMPLVLIKDVHAAFAADILAEIDRLAREYAFMVEEVFEEDLAARFARHEFVLCPAGTRYFRIWNDGTIEGCPYVEQRRLCGNLKARRFAAKQGLFACHTARHCDCNNIALTGKMVFPAPTQSGR